MTEFEGVTFLIHLNVILDLFRVIKVIDQVKSYIEFNL